MVSDGTPFSGSLLSKQSDAERVLREEFGSLFRALPIPNEELMGNLGLFVRRQLWGRYLFLHHIYQHVLTVHGVVMEFGCRWGQNLALFSAFRGLYEPFNFSRKIVGFDTFEGFPSVDPKDGRHEVIHEGGYSLPQGWENTLTDILSYHEAESPISHMRKFELVKGDVSGTLPDYLSKHPETVIALAYFDLDLYRPTWDALNAIRPHLTRGAVIGFDEVCLHEMPGETIALREILGLENVRLERLPISPQTSYIIWNG